MSRDEKQNERAALNEHCDCDACGQQPYLLEEIRNLRAELASVKAERDEAIRHASEVADLSSERAAAARAEGFAEALAEREPTIQQLSEAISAAKDAHLCDLTLPDGAVARAERAAFEQCRSLALSALANERVEWGPGYDGIQHALRLAEHAVRALQPAEPAPSLPCMHKRQSLDTDGEWHCETCEQGWDGDTGDIG